MIGGEFPFYVQIWRIVTHPPPFQNAEIQSIFARSASAVTVSHSIQALDRTFTAYCIIK